MGKKKKKKERDQPASPPAESAPPENAAAAAWWRPLARRLGTPAGAFLAVVLFSLILRLLFLNAGFFHLDSIHYHRAVKKTVTSFEQGQLEIHGHLEGRYGYVLLGVPVYYLADLLSLPHDVAFNGFTAVCGALAAGVLCLLANLVFGSLFLGVASGVLLSVFPPFLSITTHTKEHGLSALLLILAAYCVVRGNRNGSRLMFFLSGLAFAYSVAVRIPNAIMGLPLVLFYLEPSWKNGAPSWKRPRPGDLVCLLIPIVACAALIYHFQLEAIMAKAGYDAWLGMFSDVFDTALDDLSTSLVGGVGMIFLIAGLAYGLFAYRARTIYLLAWILPFLFFYANTRTYSIRFLTPCFPPLAILLALGALPLQRLHRFAGAVPIAVLALGMFATIHPIIDFRSKYSGGKEYGLWLKNQTPENARIVVMDDSGFVRYYAKRQILPHPRDGDPVAVEEWIERLQRIIERGDPIYLMQSGLAYDPGGLVKRAIFKNFDVELVGKQLMEDYHHKSIRSGRYEQKLFRLWPKQKPAQ